MCEGTNMTLPDDFIAFWAIWPRKIAKGDAFKAWTQTEEMRPDMETLLKKIREATSSWRSEKREMSFIPYPATWLRAWGWEDEYKIALTSTPANSDATSTIAEYKSRKFHPDGRSKIAEIKSIQAHR